MVTSSKNSWQKSASPVTCLIVSIVTPGWPPSGTMNIDRPRCFGTSQSVRASIRPWVATSAPEVQILEPLITQVSPSRVARVSAPARSEPPDGSDSNCTKISSPRRIAGR